MTNLAIAANGLRKSYGDKVVLDGVDLAVPEGTIFSLLGPNGAGKTTAVKILSTLICADPGTGDIHIGGHDLAADPQAVRAAIGVTGQFSAVDGLPEVTAMTARATSRNSSRSRAAYSDTASAYAAPSAFSAIRPGDPRAGPSGRFRTSASGSLCVMSDSLQLLAGQLSRGVRAGIPGPSRRAATHTSWSAWDKTVRPRIVKSARRGASAPIDLPHDLTL